MTNQEFAALWAELTEEEKQEVRLFAQFLVWRKTNGKGDAT